MTAPYTLQDQSTGIGDFNITSFLIQQLISRVNVATVVKIVAVTNNGGLSPVGYVDVEPQVNQLNGQRKAIPHGVVYNLPYVRIQGGMNAIILDPQVGDLGLAVFADRDISAVKVAKGRANPGSFRRNAMPDGIYVGGMLNGTPVQYVQFNAAGISVVSPTLVKIKAPSIILDGPVMTTSTIMATGEITAVTTPLHSHMHTNVTHGTDVTGPPTP